MRADADGEVISMMLAVPDTASIPPDPAMDEGVRDG
jgi:hypothetical protein